MTVFWPIIQEQQKKQRRKKSEPLPLYIEVEPLPPQEELPETEKEERGVIVIEI